MTNWLEFLYDALSQSYGICIEVSDAKKAKQALYRARREAGDPSLDQLKIRSSPLAPNAELWIVRQEK